MDLRYPNSLIFSRRELTAFFSQLSNRRRQRRWSVKVRLSSTRYLFLYLPGGRGLSAISDVLADEEGAARLLTASVRSGVGCLLT